MQATIRARAGDGLRGLTAEDWDLAVIDSLPVPVVNFAHAHCDHRRSGQARYGRPTAKSQIFHGYKLNLLVPAGGRARLRGRLGQVVVSGVRLNTGKRPTLPAH